MTPVRGDAPVLVATAYLSVLLPGPLPPDVMLIHEARLCAVQLHVEMAVTFTVALAPSAPTDLLCGVIPVIHDAPDCVTVKVWPAISIEPVRSEVVVLAATE
jgi:hypothetical protein